MSFLGARGANRTDSKLLPIDQTLGANTGSYPRKAFTMSTKSRLAPGLIVATAAATVGIALAAAAPASAIMSGGGCGRGVSTSQPAAVRGGGGYGLGGGGCCGLRLLDPFRGSPPPMARESRGR